MNRVEIENFDGASGYVGSEHYDCVAIVDGNKYLFDDSPGRDGEGCSIDYAFRIVRDDVDGNRAIGERVDSRDLLSRIEAVVDTKWAAISKEWANYKKSGDGMTQSE